MFLIFVLMVWVNFLWYKFLLYILYEWKNFGKIVIVFFRLFILKLFCLGFLKFVDVFEKKVDVENIVLGDEEVLF